MTPTKIFGLLLVIAYIAGLRILTALDIGTIFEHRLLLPILNTLFAGILPIVVAYVAGKNYLKGGSLTSLYMGCGMLSFGLCAISAGWLIRASDGANLNVTVYNTGALLGSVFHAIGAILSLVGIDYSDGMKQRRLKSGVAYIGILLFVICFSLAALGGLVPPFFVQGVGPTGLRQAILGSSVFLYFMSAIFLMAFHFRSKSNFLYWYSLCLAMLAIGLLAFFVQKSVGSPIGWLGRSANYFGGIFALVAVLGALRNEKARGVTPEQSIFKSFVDSESSYRIGLIPVLPLPIILILFVILASVHTRTVFDPPGLLAALNTLFISILPLVVVYVATKGYLRSGNLTMLMLGSATLTLGLGSPLAGWVITLEGGGPNANVTVFNLSALFSATFHLLGGVLAFTGAQARKNPPYKILTLVLTYLGIAILLTVLTSATLKGMIPVFFVQGEGSTVWRHNVLLTATVFFTISGVLFTVLYLFSRAKFLYRYSLALFLLAIGLIGLILLKSVGSPIGWMARTAQYLSGIYLLMAVVSASRDVRAKGESLDRGIANLFRHHLELLVEKRTLELSQAKEELQAAHAELERGNAELFKTNQQLRALMDALPVGVSFSDDISCQRITGNPCLFAQFEITPEDNISASAPDPNAMGRLVRYFHNGQKSGMKSCRYNEPWRKTR